MLVTDRPAAWDVRLTTHVPQIHEPRGLGTTYPENDVNVEVHQTPVYTFGSASYVFHNGAHAETPWLSWSITTPVRKLGDFKNGFFRFLHHDALPEGDSNESVFDKGNPGYVLWNEGRKFTFQSGNRAILFAHPDRIVPTTTRLGLSFFATELGGCVDGVWLGGKPVAIFPAASDTPESVVIQDGKFYLAMIPLPGNDDLGREHAVEIRHTPTKYLQVSFLNYQGGRAGMNEFGYTRNGLYLETGDASQYPTIGKFLQHVAQIHVTETDDEDIREVEVAAPSGSMSAVYNRRTEQFLSRVADGIPYVPQAISCPRAALGLQGTVAVGKISAACTPKQPLLLAADPDRHVFTLLNFGESATTVTLSLPTHTPLTYSLRPYEERVLVNP